MSAPGTEQVPSHGHLQVKVQEDPEVWRDLPGEEDVNENNVVNAAKSQIRRVPFCLSTVVMQVSPLLIMSTSVVFWSTI